MLNGGEEPLKVRWIKTKLKKHDRKLPEDMLKEEEVELMIDTALNKRDKAIIALLWDIGARIGEIGNLRVKDIHWSSVKELFPFSLALF